MGHIFDAVTKFFADDSWPYAQLEGSSILQTGFQGETGQWTCYAQAREEQEQFVFYSVCPVIIPEDKRPALSEFLTRANFGMVIGNFELDLDDGEIRYKTSIDVEGDRLSEALIRQMVYVNVATMERYLSGILAVTFGTVTPIEALARIEND